MNLLFVHGINVRGDAWFAGLGLISRKAKKFLPDYDVTGCGWGDPFGARLHREGASIPNYNPTGNSLPANAQANRALWYLLSGDPLLELRLLPAKAYIGTPPGQEIFASLPALKATPWFKQCFRSGSRGTLAGVHQPDHVFPGLEGRGHANHSHSPRRCGSRRTGNHRGLP